MTDLAQKLFIEKKRHTPWNSKAHIATRDRWPTLVKLLDKGSLTYADYSLAQTLLKQIDPATEAIGALICHLSLAAKNGHLCIRYHHEKISPEVKKLWSIDDEEDELVAHIESLIVDGFHSLPQSLYASIEDTDSLKPLYLWDDLLYLQKYWTYETNFVNSINQVEEASALLHPNMSLVDAEIQNLLDNNKLLPEQAKAIQLGCSKNLAIISGGPGTGKTYTAGHLIRIFYQSLSCEDQNKCKIVLAAPTGKAASNLQNSFMNSLSGINLNKPVEAKTLHSLLLTNRSQEYVSANLFVIDEASMIDAKIMSKLFMSIRPGSKIILLGDRYQLPPVEAGSIFSDLLTTKIKANHNSVAILTKCVRADIQTIVLFSQKINEGDSESVIALLNADDETINRHPLNEVQDLVKEVMPKFEMISKNTTDYSELLEIYNTYRILIPLRKGPFGVDSINTLILNKILKNIPLGSPLIAPIIITKNDYQLELFNGETGILIKQNPRSESMEKGDLAIFPSNKPNESIRKIPALLLKEFDYAYCISIHKSQGSEFDEIAIILPNNSEHFDREILYTAVTRAKKKITLWCSEETLTNCLKNTSKRISGIDRKIN
ncbi:MAG: exodeoxyribonuclease V subunit alpha [Chlamydiota bacterium]|nr:exodeoxyribonuclease V subunit alpha [Chlamydiota bacterium]